MTYQRAFFDFAADCLIKGFRFHRGGRLQSHFLERVRPVFTVRHRGLQLQFCCPNSLIHWRLQTFATKEPETLAWIESFDAGDVLFDVGANIGLYTLYAAARGIQVSAFEPEAQNYAELNRNIYLNQLAPRVQAICCAFSDQCTVNTLHLSDYRPGAALGGLPRVEQSAPSSGPVFLQGTLAFTLDHYLSLCPAPFPTHLKIDVDGLEARIIQGAQCTLRDPRLRSVLVEIDERNTSDCAIQQVLLHAGFHVQHRARSPLVEDGTPHAHVFNYIFSRGAPS